jgi:hypothetical protein
LEEPVAGEALAGLEIRIGTWPFMYLGKNKPM